jgi:hypothetical protein
MMKKKKRDMWHEGMMQHLHTQQHHILAWVGNQHLVPQNHLPVFNAVLWQVFMTTSSSSSIS